MPRRPIAMKTLIAELGVEPTEVGDMDGYGVYRSATFDVDPTLDLTLQAISVDKRIQSYADGKVSFVTDIAADVNAPFGTAAIEKIEIVPDPEPTLEERLNDKTAAELRKEYGFDPGVTKKGMIAALLEDRVEISSAD